jgi:glycosyltransferase involved in cell wall biosynthesis
MNNILLILPDSDRVQGGASIHAKKFFTFLESNNHTCEIIYTTKETKSGRILDALLVLLIILFRREKILYMHLGDNILANIRDTVFVCFARLLSKRIIFHSHSGRDPCEYFLRINICIMNRFSNVEVVTLCNKIRAQFKVIDLTLPIYVIPNGISSASISTDDSHIDLADVQKCIFVGKFGVGKGETIVKLVAERLHKKRLNFEVKLIGNENEFEASEHVELLGRMSNEDVMEFLERADIFLFPTKYITEGFPMVILEAMACSCAVISTNYRCIPELVNSQNGFLIEVSDDDIMADEIVKHLEKYNKNPGILISQKRKSRELVKENFSETKSFEKLTDILYEQKILF